MIRRAKAPVALSGTTCCRRLSTMTVVRRCLVMMTFGVSRSVRSPFLVTTSAKMGFRAPSVLLRCSPFVHCSPREKLVAFTSGGEYSEPPRFLDVAINVAVVEQRQLIQQPQQWSVLSRQPHHEALLPAFPLVRTDLCPHLATCTGRHRPELNQ